MRSLLARGDRTHGCGMPPKKRGCEGGGGRKEASTGTCGTIERQKTAAIERRLLKWRVRATRPLFEMQCLLIIKWLGHESAGTCVHPRQDSMAKSIYRQQQ